MQGRADTKLIRS